MPLSSKIINIGSKNFKNYKIIKIESGASTKKFYRITNNQISYIITDFGLDKNEYFNHIKIYDLLKNINISIPRIIEKYENDNVIISEDLGDLRFDKILEKYDIKKLLKYSIDTLIEINNKITFNSKSKLQEYNFNIFKTEIIELTNFYFPYIGIKDKNLIDDFLFIWKKSYNKIDFNYKNFIHKDFNINNLILIPSNKGYLKCGVIDFQSAFWGESSWDLFSLLEDSRIMFNDEFNDYFIEYFYFKTYNNISFEEFKIKYYFLNTSRQTRLLGRWIKLSEQTGNKWYLNFIPITKKRLLKSLSLLNNKDLQSFYNKHNII